jgi:hypothetical protein
MSKMNTDQKSTEQTAQWANLMAEIFDRLTGRGAEIAYNFQNLEIDTPKAINPDGHGLGSAKWTINGRLIITAQTQDSNLK